MRMRGICRVAMALQEKFRELAVEPDETLSQSMAWGHQWLETSSRPSGMSLSPNRLTLSTANSRKL